MPTPPPEHLSGWRSRTRIPGKLFLSSWLVCCPIFGVSVKGPTRKIRSLWTIPQFPSHISSWTRSFFFPYSCIGSGNQPCQQKDLILKKNEKKNRDKNNRSIKLFQQLFCIVCATPLTMAIIVLVGMLIVRIARDLTKDDNINVLN